MFAVIRMSHYAFGANLMRGTWAHYVCLALAMVSIVYGSAMAVREPHMKRRLAYSTMSNLSYVLLGVMLLTPEGLKGGLLHMLYHAVMKITLFSCVGAIMVRTGRSYVQEVRGMGKKMPFTMGVLAFAAIGLVGIPPFIGFQSKWALASAAVNSGSWMGVAAVAVLLVSAVLTAIYMLIPTIGAYAAPLDENGLREGNCDPGWRMKLPFIILCVMMLVMAFCSQPLNNYLSSIV